MKKLLYFIVLISVILQAGFFSGMSVRAAETWPIYHEIVVDEARGWLYGSDSAGHKIDVIRISDLKLVKSFILPTTAAPKGIALSPDGGELAVANYGRGDLWSPTVGSIIFINLVTGKIIVKLVPDLSGYYTEYNRPWDVVYGRPGILYSSGNPNSSGYDFIHIINTVDHIEIGRSSFQVRMGPTLAISADKNRLYYYESDQSPRKLQWVDVSTDTLPDPVASPHADWLRGSKFILSADETKIFLDSGQVWNSSLQGPLGSTSWAGNMVLLPTHNAIAVAEDRSGTDLIRFVSTTNYYGIKSYTLPALGTIGPLAALSNGTKLFVSSSTGIVAVDLSAGLPGKAIAKPAGALPYYDLVADEARGVLYGSDPLGQKIDVIQMSDLAIIRKVRLVNGASPVDIELSPDGAQLAVAQYGASSIIFLNPVDWTVIGTVTPNVNSKNMPWKIAYGRPGRLYSVGNPNSMGMDYIHVIDTSATPPTEIETSVYTSQVRMCPEMRVSSDGNRLYVHETCQSPQKISEYDITTDTPASIESTPHASWLTGASFVLSDDNKIFVDSGQVWNSDLTGRIGATGQAGFLALLPSRNALAVSVDTTTTDKVVFYSTNNYYGIRAYTLPVQGVLGPMAATATGDRLFVSTSSGVVAVDLSDSLPGALIAKPKGALPYFDLVMDEARGVLYGSDPAGHKIDVVSMATQQVIAKYYLVNGATPTGIALSPDGSELAVAEYGASSIVFLNPETGETIASLTPQIDSLNLPWDVIYGRPGRLYSTGTPTSYGLDNIHVIDTGTHLEVGRSGLDYYLRNHPSLAISSDGNTLFVEESYPSSLMLHKYDVSTDVPNKDASLNLGVTIQKASILLLADQTKIISSAGQIVDVDAGALNKLAIFTAVGPLAEIPSQHSFASANGTSLNFYDLNTYQKIGFFPMTGVTSLGPMQVKSDDSILYVSTNVGIKPVDLTDYPPVNPTPSPINLRSIASQDGWILEAGETTGTGGQFDSRSELTVGDDYTNEQYVSILSFNTGFLMPHSAVVTKVTIKIKTSGIVENTPFATLRYLTADIKSGSFGAVSLAPPDFETVASLRDIGRFAKVPGTKWYQLVLKPAAIQFINRFGVTQFRLRFARDDDNDERSDYLNFYSGETKVIADRPTLIIEYVVP